MHDSNPDAATAVLDDAGWTPAATQSEFGEARKLVVRRGDHQILLIRLGGGIVAIENQCGHLGRPLDTGRVMGGQIICPFHGACFDLRSGAAVAGPAVKPLRLFPVRLEGEMILINLRTMGAGDAEPMGIRS